MNSFAAIVGMFVLFVLIALEFYIKNNENKE